MLLLIVACFCNAFFTECTVTNFSTGDLAVSSYSTNNVAQDPAKVAGNNQNEGINYTNTPSVQDVSDNTITNSFTGAFKDAFVYLFEHISAEGK